MGNEHDKLNISQLTIGCIILLPVSIACWVCYTICEWNEQPWSQLWY